MIQPARFDNLSLSSPRTPTVRPRYWHSPILSIAIVLLMAGVAGADDYDDLPELSLQEVIDATLRSPDAMTSLVDIEDSDGSLEFIRGELNWTADVSLDGNGSFSPDLPVVIGGTAGVSKNLFTGGSVSFGVRGSQSTGTRASPTSSIANTFVQANQPLLRGAGWQGFAGQKKIAESQLRVTRAARRSAINGLLQNVIISYWQVASTLERLKLLRSSLEATEEQLRVIETRRQVGRVSTSEVDLLKQDIAVQKSQIFDAQSQFSTASASLRQAAGLPASDGRVEFRPSTPLRSVTKKYEREALAVLALQRNPQLSLQRANLELASKTAADLESDRGPRLDLTFNASSSLQQQNTEPTAESEVPQNTESQTWQIGLNFQQELGTKRSRGLTRQATAARRRARINMEITRQQILAQVAQASARYETSRLRVIATQRAMERAQRVVSSERARYQAGRSTTFNILNRIERLRQAEQANTQAKADLLIALAQIDGLTGKLIDRHGGR